MKDRVAYFDNARFLLIVLVVIGHSLAQIKTDGSLAGTAYVFIYTFHMPAFILITGYLSRRFEWNRRGVQRTLATLVAPVILFELVSQIVLKYYTGDDFAQINPFVTQWLGWFLWAMVLWRVLTPVMLSLRWPLAWAVGISLFSPYYDWPNLMASTKVMGFLPFYVAGLLLTQHHFEWLKSRSVRMGSSAVLALAFAAAYFWPSSVSTTVLLWKRNYSDTALETLTGSALADRAVLMLIGFVLTAAFLSLVSWAHHAYTVMGTRTLYCYLTHGFVILVLVEALSVDEWWPEQWYGTIAFIALSTLLALALLTRPVQRVFKPVFEPRLDFLFRSADRH